MIETDHPASLNSGGDESHFRSILEHAGELARLLLKSPQPPRRLTSEYLHGRKRLTTESRGYISSLAFHALRCWRPARRTLTGTHDDVETRTDKEKARAICAAALLLALVPDAPFPLPQELVDSPWDNDVMTRVAAQLTDGENATPLVPHLASDASLPDWVVTLLRDHGTPDDDILRIGKGLCAPSPLVLRVNTMRITRAGLIERLNDAGIGANAHPRLPAAVIVETRVPLLESSLYDEGLFEVQDAGSQLISYACGVAPGAAVLDACAGGGGKTMHLLDLMHDNGSVLACDIERNKLRGLRQRATRVSSTALDTLAITPAGEPQRAGESLPGERTFDCVLVDAPCSGFGTVRRNPALKWRLQERTVERLRLRQLDILSRNAEFVRAGGFLLYATCSLLPTENDRVVDTFLEQHPDYLPDPLTPVLAGQGIVLDGLAEDENRLTVSPSLLDSDGFFMTRFRRS